MAPPKTAQHRLIPDLSEVQAPFSTRFLSSPPMNPQVGARVPGVRPGDATVEFFRNEQNRSRFFGGFLLATLSTARSP